MPLDLSKLNTPQGKRDALLGALLLAVVADVGINLATDDPDREVKLADLGDALARGSAAPRQQRADNLDTGELHRVVKAIRAADPQLVDLGGMLVQPGATVEAGGNLNKGTTLVGWESGCMDLVAPNPDNPDSKPTGRYDAASKVCILGPGFASWTVLGSSCADRDESTWCEVRLRNDAKEPLRPVVFVRRAP